MREHVKRQQNNKAYSKVVFKKTVKEKIKVNVNKKT